MPKCTVRSLGQPATKSATLVSPPGFPTHEQYMEVEAAYLDSLSKVKRKKALITQEMFDNIWDVLLDPNLRIMNAQFRFWVRKMFRLSEPFSSDSTDPAWAGDPIVLHRGRPVAIKEQLYELLCYCHALARHGGRDKTCAAVRQHYSWIPKELIARFVMVCPTCILKKTGGPQCVPSLLNRSSSPTSQNGGQGYDSPALDAPTVDVPTVDAPTVDNIAFQISGLRGSVSISELMHDGAYAEVEERPNVDAGLILPCDSTAATTEVLNVLGSSCSYVSRSPHQDLSYPSDFTVQLHGWQPPEEPFDFYCSTQRGDIVLAQSGQSDPFRNNVILPPLMKSLSQGSLGGDDVVHSFSNMLDISSPPSLPPSLHPFRIGPPPTMTPFSHVEPALLADEDRIARLIQSYESGAQEIALAECHLLFPDKTLAPAFPTRNNSLRLVGVDVPNSNLNPDVQPHAAPRAAKRCAPAPVHTPSQKENRPAFVCGPGGAHANTSNSFKSFTIVRASLDECGWPSLSLQV